MTISQIKPQQLPGTSDAAGDVVAIGPREREQAVAALVDAHGPAGRHIVDRFLEHARKTSLRLDLFWGVVDGAGRMLDSVLAVPNPGRTAMLFASRCHEAADRMRVSRLARHACAALKSEGVVLAQTLIEPQRREDAKAFLDAGFMQLARLSYMERKLPAAPLSIAPPPRVELTCYDRSLDHEFKVALEGSYEQTLDCPGLCGLRDTSDVLEGHRATGNFEPHLWTLLRVDGRAAGVLLLNASSVSRTVELVYLGLKPGVRGRGLGRFLLRHGLNLLAGRDERSVQLAVDEANLPAIRLYRSEGFHRVLRRVALVKSLP